MAADRRGRVVPRPCDQGLRPGADHRRRRSPTAGRPVRRTPTAGVQRRRSPEGRVRAPRAGRPPAGRRRGHGRCRRRAPSDLGPRPARSRGSTASRRPRPPRRSSRRPQPDVRSSPKLRATASRTLSRSMPGSSKPRDPRRSGPHREVRCSRVPRVRTHGAASGLQGYAVPGEDGDQRIAGVAEHAQDHVLGSQAEGRGPAPPPWRMETPATGVRG